MRRHQIRHAGQAVAFAAGETSANVWMFVSNNSTSITCFMLSALLTSCDPAVRVHGRVTSSDGPIRRAEVRVDCPQLCGFAVVDDDNGSYSGSKMGGCPLNCRLRVRSSGYDDFVSPIGKCCTDQSRGICSDIAASVVLKRSTP